MSTWLNHPQHTQPAPDCHLCVKPIPASSRIDLTLVDSDDARISTRIQADENSVDFSTTDHEGNEQEPSFELTWKEIFQACREYRNQ